MRRPLPPPSLSSPHVTSASSPSFSRMASSPHFQPPSSQNPSRPVVAPSSSRPGPSAVPRGITRDRPRPTPPSSHRSSAPVPPPPPPPPPSAVALVGSGRSTRRKSTWDEPPVYETQKSERLADGIVEWVMHEFVGLELEHEVCRIAEDVILTAFAMHSKRSMVEQEEGRVTLPSVDEATGSDTSDSDLEPSSFSMMAAIELHLSYSIHCLSSSFCSHSHTRHSTEASFPSISSRI